MYKYEVHLSSRKDGKYNVDENILYNIGDIEVAVPKGYITDGASIPKIFHIWKSPFSTPQIYAVVLHDYLIDNRRVRKNGKLMSITRRQADKLFLITLLTCGTSVINSLIYYVGVSIRTNIKPIFCLKKK